MKQKGNSIIGDPVQVDLYTSSWLSVRLHPMVYYRRMDEIEKSLKKSKGLYAEIDMGEFVTIRFSDKDDLTNFHRIHHQYV